MRGECEGEEKGSQVVLTINMHFCPYVGLHFRILRKIPIIGLKPGHCFCLVMFANVLLGVNSGGTSSLKPSLCCAHVI